MSDPLTICPWCREPVMEDDTIQERAGVTWHASCKDRFDTANRNRRGPRPISGWTLVMRFANGHRFWKRAESSHLWICDASGDLPDQCADRPHYVDKTGLLRPCEHGFSIPILFSEDNGSFTVCDASTAFWLAEVHGMQIRVGQRTYTVKPA